MEERKYKQEVNIYEPHAVWLVVREREERGSYPLSTNETSPLFHHLNFSQSSMRRYPNADYMTVGIADLAPYGLIWISISRQSINTEIRISGSI